MKHLDETTIALFVERRLADPEVAHVEGHIDGCTDCRALVAGLARHRQSAAGELAVGTPAGDGEATAGAEPTLEGGARLGRYLVIDALGHGAMGVVYAAFDPDLDRRVAVKLLRPGAAASDDARTRLMREAQALAKVSHPAVIAVHDVGTHAGQTFLAMELVDGGTLRAWLRQPRPWHAIVTVMAQVGRGLAAAHATGLIHRDVKPDNILVEKSGGARIGIAGCRRASTAPCGGAWRWSRRGASPT